VHAIFRDVVEPSGKQSQAGPALSVLGDNRSRKKSVSGMTKSTMSSMYGRRATLPNAAGSERFGPVKGKDIRVTTL